MNRAKRLAAQDLNLVLEHTAPLWEDARNQRIFLTGGTGFFGCWLVESFCYMNRQLGLDAEATVLTRNPEGFAKKCPHLASDPAVHLLPGDVRNFDFPDGQYAYVIHAATEASARQAAEAPLEMLSTIIAGTERTLEFAATCGAKKVLLTSSGAVYGRQPADLIQVPESYTGAPEPLDPANVYAEGKRISELLCSIYQKQSGMECKIARCWAFCGPHLPLDQHFAIGNFIGDILAGRPIQIRGDGTPRRSYLYAADLTVWLWTMLFRAPALVPFNVGSAHDVSILELAQVIATTLNPKAEIHIAQQSVPGAAPIRYVPAVDRAREVLGLREIIPLNEAIRRTAKWYREQ
ncbi:NAD-dependent epimerase/dehydratase family protein [Alloacidobacterium sp.]|uniref:NAD-dependent epimerase/dehydratase family protein n=1 Tax=Alloacidobacterium sp. TaxID=2951999 RepID=UPI002D23CF98|nr:NAD-dependent epimerase/dehydratase family protein [Alloacidobacterium sp.]HYK37947.1 NAD-dependent epimerase/dehydratase family protein [Alloacidobacterium sp.]